MKETVLGLNKGMKYYFCNEAVNMGKGIDGLCGVIRSNLLRDPFSCEVFIFLSRNRKQVKILRWNDGAFVLYTVRLYKGRNFRPAYHSATGSYLMRWDDFLDFIGGNQENIRKQING